MNPSSSPGLRFLLDQGLPGDAARILRTRGYDCTHVGEIGMHQSEDEKIVAYAAEHRLVIVTLDADFHALLAVSGATRPSVIRIRLQRVNADYAVALLEAAVAIYSRELAAGGVVTIKSRKTTCHRLPIGRAD